MVSVFSACLNKANCSESIEFFWNYVIYLERVITVERLFKATFYSSSQLITFVNDEYKVALKS